MKQIYPKLGHECSQRQSDSGRFNPSMIAKVKHSGKTYVLVLNCGSADNTSFFQERDCVYVVSINTGLGYCGADCYVFGDTRNPYTESETYEADLQPGPFLDNDTEIAETLGPRGLDLTPRTILKRLAEYFTC